MTNKTVYAILTTINARGEDCLNLNIWRNPADKNEKKPILVLLIGGFDAGTDAAQEIIQTMAVKFIKAQPMELYADEPHGLPALKWQLCDRKFGTYLYVGEKDAFCMPFHRPL